MSLARVLTLAVVLCLTGASALAAESRPSHLHKPTISTGNDVLVSARSSVRFKAFTGVDTFCLYGGPGTSAGKFQDAGGGAAPLGHAPHDILPGQWYGVDLTEMPTFWQVASSNGVTSSCFENLDGDGSSGGVGDGPGNQAWWAGRTPAQEPGWATAPGYGNSWNALLEWRAAMLDPNVGQIVGLTFAFHHDTEYVYDFFSVEYDSASFLEKEVYAVDGSNAPFAAPGVQYPADVVSKPIVYGPQGYSPGDDEIVLRLAVTSDGAWSDEDGLWPTTCGAAIVDDITVTWTDGVQPHVDFSDVDTSNSWQPVVPDYAGDFSAIHPRFRDIDPCAENTTPVAGFMDFDQCPPNQYNNGGDPPCQSTGGTPGAGYGIDGEWGFNVTGGLTDGSVAVANEIWSPPIAWDLPGSEDDDPAVAGALLRFDSWQDLPLTAGVFWQWHVRTSSDGGVTWGSWEDYGSFNTGFGPVWRGFDIVITPLVVENGLFPTHVQMALGAYDLCNLFGSCIGVVPGPVFDNVRLSKFRVDGPSISASEVNLFMDGFPQSGNVDFVTLAGRQVSDVRLDIRDVDTAMPNVPGDSMVVHVTPGRSGSTVTSVELEWILDVNPKFDDVRVQPAGTSVIADGARNGWDQWSGTLAGQLVATGGVYAFDLPDEDFFHPGDELRFYVRAEDDLGGMSTLPADLDGFDSGRTANHGYYHPDFTTRALPSAVDDGLGGWTQPTVLAINDFRTTDAVEEYRQVFDQNAWTPGVQYDTYTVRGGPMSNVGNGIGSAGAHGATAAQLAGYAVILYFAGDSRVTLGDGLNDPSDDLGVITSWFEQNDVRFLAHFGDDVVSSLAQSSAGATYLQTVAGVQLVDGDVSDDIGQTAPLVKGVAGSCFDGVDYVAFGGCPTLNDFDYIEPRAGAVTTHLFCDAAGNPIAGPAASVLWDRLDGSGNRKVTATFPYDLVYVWDAAEPEAGPSSKRSELVQTLIDDCFGQVIAGGPVPTRTPPALVAGPYSLAVHPNPFNPTTTIAFELGSTMHTMVTIYDLRGTLIVRLHDGVLSAGPQRLPWSGRDHRGRFVASGIYVVEVEGGGERRTAKVALVK